MNASAPANGHARRRVRSIASATLVAILLAPTSAAPAQAMAIVSAVPMACPISNPFDVAVVGADTIVVGSAENAGSPVGDAVLCRIQPSGAAAWTTTIPGVSWISNWLIPPVAVAAGSSGIYVGWTARDGNLQDHARVQRFSLDGTAQQTATTASGANDTFEDVAVAPDGRVYIIGTTVGQLGDAPPPPTAGSHVDAFVRAFEPTLSVRWTSQLHATITGPYEVQQDGFASGTAIAVDASGVYVVGGVTGSLPDMPPSSTGSTFVRRYSSGGTITWTRKIEVQAVPADVAVSAQGVHVVGQSYAFGDRDPERWLDAFQRLYDHDGNVLWTREIGAVNQDYALKVLSDRAGSIVFGYTTVGLGAYAEGIWGLVFLARFGPTGAPGPVIEYAPWGWWQQGAKVVSDGETVRIASVVPPEWQPPEPGPYVIPPQGTRLIRIDAIPPSVGTPSVRALTKSTAGTSTVSLTAAWTVSDGASAITGVEAQVSKDAGTWTSLSGIGPTTRSAPTSGRMGGTIRVRVRSTDAVGNTSEWKYGPTVTLALVQETSSSIKESPSWGRVVRTGALGGHVDRTKNSGAWARYKFTGRAVAWISTTGPTRGRAAVYIDGKYVTTIDTYAAAFTSRRIVFERSWTATGTHTIEIRNKATSSRPRIDIDGFLVLKQ